LANDAAASSFETREDALLRMRSQSDRKSGPCSMSFQTLGPGLDLMVRSALRRQMYVACVNLATMRVSNHESQERSDKNSSELENAL